MKTPVTNTNDPAVERNISRSDMDIVIAVLDKMPELTEVSAKLDTLPVLEANVVDKANEVAANTLIVQSETATTVSNAASALASKDAAEVSEINASNSANSASISKDNALASAISANASAQSALESKDSANLSAVSASASESIATQKALEASVSASTAMTSETNASLSASNANTSEVNSLLSEQNALQSETNAAISETNALNSAEIALAQSNIASTKATESSASAMNALTSETNANDSEVMSHKWAQEAEDVIVTGTLGVDEEYSAYHWAQKAQATAGGNIPLGSLYDVDTIGIVDGGIITYNQSTGKYVPYDFRHNPYIGLNTTGGVIADVGQFTWNATEGTADLGLPNGVTLQLGQENNRLVRNNTASTILNGTVVVATGSIGASGRITVAPCGGTSNDVHAIYGVTTQDILAGEDGFITIDGKIRLINTSGSNVGETWNAGDVLYVKPNDNGRLTNVVPSTGELKVSIAKVIRAHATTGILEVRTLSVLDENAYEPRNTNIQSHIADTANPHGVTKLQIGLGNAEDTADNVKNVLSATKLTTGRTIGMTGDVAWTSASFNGSSNVTGTSTLATITDSGTGTFKKITTDTKGRVTGTQAVAQADITGLLGAGSITNTMIANTAVANLSGTNTGNQTITLTGDVTGSGTGSFAATLSNSGVTAGTYSKVTVDAKGRITGGSIPTMEDIPDATFKRSVRVATTANITLSAAQTIDGIVLAIGDRVLVKNQTTTSENGIYVIAAGAWTRALDANTSSKIASALVAVDSGTVNGGKLFDNDFKTTDTLGTTAMLWASNLDSAHLLTSPSTSIGAVAYNGTTAAAGNFDGGSTTPTGTARLNYGGYFYPTYINLSASADTADASSHYFVETASDGYVRPKTLANVRAEIITKAALLSADPYYFSSGVGTSGITTATNYPIFPASNDTLTLGVGTYRVSLTMYCTVATSTVSATLMINMRGAGTAVGTTGGRSTSSITNGGAAIQTTYAAVALGNTHTVTSASAVAGRVYTVYLDMVMNITTAGTIIPSYQWSATLTNGVVTLYALNNIVIDKMAETSVTTAGEWA